MNCATGLGPINWFGFLESVRAKSRIPGKLSDIRERSTLCSSSELCPAVEAHDRLFSSEIINATPKKSQTHRVSHYPNTFEIGKSSG